MLDAITVQDNLSFLEHSKLFFIIAYLLNFMPGFQTSHSLSAISAELIDTIQVRSSLRWICLTFLWIGKMSCVGGEMSFNQAYLIAQLPANQASDTSVYRIIEVDSPTRGVFRSKDDSSEAPLMIIESNFSKPELTETNVLESEPKGEPLPREEKLEQNSLLSMNQVYRIRGKGSFNPDVWG